MDKPLYDSIRGLAPTISIEQKAASGNPRSTVGTITEIHDYLRVLWARVGRLTCHRCGRPVSQQSAQQIVHEIADAARRARSSCCWPRSCKERKGEHRDVLEQVRKAGFTRVRVDGVVVSLEDDDPAGQEEEAHDRRGGRPPDRQGRAWPSACTTRWRRRCATAAGIVIVAPEGQPEQVMSQHRACHDCGISFPEPSPQLFSFNSPQGMCPECSGLGTRMEMDPELVGAQPGPLDQRGRGQAAGRGGRGRRAGARDIVRAVARERGIDLNKPWKALPAAAPHA